VKLQEYEMRRWWCVERRGEMLLLRRLEGVTKEVKGLQGQLADYNFVLDKVRLLFLAFFQVASRVTVLAPWAFINASRSSRVRFTCLILLKQPPDSG
jgi:hypothetical protein